MAIPPILSIWRALQVLVILKLCVGLTGMNDIYHQYTQDPSDADII